MPTPPFVEVDRDGSQVGDVDQHPAEDDDDVRSSIKVTIPKSAQLVAYPRYAQPVPPR